MSLKCPKCDSHKVRSNDATTAYNPTQKECERDGYGFIEDEQIFYMVCDECSHQYNLCYKITPPKTQVPNGSLMLSWKNVFNSNLSKMFTTSINDITTMCGDASYDFFVWNDTVYELDGNRLDVTIEDLDAQNEKCVYNSLKRKFEMCETDKDAIQLAKEYSDDVRIVLGDDSTWIEHQEEDEQDGVLYDFKESLGTGAIVGVLELLNLEVIKP